MWCECWLSIGDAGRGGGGGLTMWNGSLWRVDHYGEQVWGSGLLREVDHYDEWISMGSVSSWGVYYCGEWITMDEVYFL